LIHGEKEAMELFADNLHNIKVIMAGFNAEFEL